MDKTDWKAENKRKEDFVRYLIENGEAEFGDDGIAKFAWSEDRNGNSYFAYFNEDGVRLKKDYIIDSLRKDLSRLSGDVAHLKSKIEWMYNRLTPTSRDEYKNSFGD